MRRKHQRSRIVIGNQTYPLGGITSIRTQTIPPNRIIPFLIGAFGVLLLIAGFSAGLSYFLVGVLLIGVAVVAWKNAKPTHTIFFGTAGGEKQALTSRDSEYVGRVAEAINKALIARA